MNSHLKISTNATTETARALFLVEPTPISDLLILVRGIKKDLEGVFGLLVAWFNKAGVSLLFHFSANVHDKNEIEIVHQIDRPDFLCTHIKFLHGTFAECELLIFNIEVYKFDDEIERIHFIDK